MAREASQDDWSQRKVLSEVMKGLDDTAWNRSPAEVLGDAIGQARQTLKAADPFAKHRADVQKATRALAERYRERVAAAPDKLAFAALCAAAANVVDAMILRDVDLEAELEALVARGFSLGKAATLREAVEPAGQVVYLLDNAGEVRFDVLLIEQLRALGKRVRVFARGAGLLHDATLSEAAEAGLGRVVEVEVPEGGATDSAEGRVDDDLLELSEGVLGTQLPGPRNLKEALVSAEVVIAKGSANYQTFSAKAARVPTVLHLLHVKCEPVAQSLGVEVGALALVRQVGQPRTGVLKRADVMPAAPPPPADDEG